MAKIKVACFFFWDTVYRCCRGLGYVDDKSVERLSVLFPRLGNIELRLCSSVYTCIQMLFNAHRVLFLCTRVYIDVVVVWATWMTSPWNVCPCYFHVLETLNFVSVHLCTRVYRCCLMHTVCCLCVHVYV